MQLFRKEMFNAWFVDVKEHVITSAKTSRLRVQKLVVVEKYWVSWIQEKSLYMETRIISYSYFG